MKPNLDTLRTEIQRYLDAKGIAVFQSFPRSPDAPAAVYWDTVRCPDFREFLAAAVAAGIRLVIFYAREFDEDMVDDALEQLEESPIDSEERHALELRLREMRGYAGFICQIEMSFDLAPRSYVFDIRTPWFEDLNGMLDHIEDAHHESEEQEPPLGGGYFSKN